MDLHDVREWIEPVSWAEVPPWRQGCCWLAGGTWLFSAQQPGVRALVSLHRLGWSEIEVDPEGLTIGATCTLAALRDHPWPEEWPASGLFADAVCALAASAKVASSATVGGNLCLALPIGTIAPLLLALEAVYEIWGPGQKVRRQPAALFQTGAGRTTLQPGEALRRVIVPIESLRKRGSYLHFSSAGEPPLAIVCGIRSDTEPWRLAVGGSVAAPLLLQVPVGAGAEARRDLLRQSCPPERLLDDFRASAAYRAHLVETLAERVLECGS